MSIFSNSAKFLYNLPPKFLKLLFVTKAKISEIRSSTNLYLCALGFSDCAVICTAIFLFCFDIIRHFSLHISLMFGVFSPIVYPAGMAAQTCSVYFTLMAAIDCFVQVSKNFSYFEQGFYTSLLFYFLCSKLTFTCITC